MPEFPIVDITDEQARFDRVELELVIAQLREGGSGAGAVPELERFRARLDQVESALELVRAWITLQLAHPDEWISPAYAGAELAMLLDHRIAPAPDPDPGRYWRDAQMIHWRPGMDPDPAEHTGQY